MKPPSLTEEQDVSHISGNVPPHIKRALSNPKAFYESRLERKIEGPVFFEGIQERLLVKEISVRPKSADAANFEGRVVVELDVEEDMVNTNGQLHGGCSATLFTTCSTLALHVPVMFHSKEPNPYYGAVSQSLNVIFHSPAQITDRIRVVATTLELGARSHSVTVEIWNMTHHRLVASGSEVKVVLAHPTSRL
ncbi:hypothetical protein HYPSUDRAFT_60425 [Hypholoma sublateritium FD-334 SS-4]|uniref:Thioesterase domain-containing protein n=1 Tax=Hypholoma sublateritium (strain FD-334 SS-4) TaxID=945553 RepID=A0A0D2LNB2_HYPSF|nr:hypothetical protein HYPSUDRAFT_60425 [Hypholoma sublateritium FD-334 SS-4]